MIRLRQFCQKTQQSTQIINFQEMAHFLKFMKECLKISKQQSKSYLKNDWRTNLKTMKKTPNFIEKIFTSEQSNVKSRYAPPYCQNTKTLWNSTVVTKPAKITTSCLSSARGVTSSKRFKKTGCSQKLRHSTTFAR